MSAAFPLALWSTSRTVCGHAVASIEPPGMITRPPQVPHNAPTGPRKDPKDLKDPRDLEDPRDPRDPKDPKDPKDLKDPRDLEDLEDLEAPDRLRAKENGRARHGVERARWGLTNVGLSCRRRLLQTDACPR